jgi:hypothetical protein
LIAGKTETQYQESVKQRGRLPFFFVCQQYQPALGGEVIACAFLFYTAQRHVVLRGVQQKSQESAAEIQAFARKRKFVCNAHKLCLPA